MSVAQNVQARLEAEELVKKEIAALLPLVDTKPEHFWRVLAELANERLDQKVKKPEVVDPLPALTDEEAVAFERSVMTFGLYEGTEVGDLPVNYIISITEDSWFIKRLKRYAKSTLFKLRQEED